jgi:hypothetical protein
MYVVHMMYMVYMRMVDHVRRVHLYTVYRLMVYHAHGVPCTLLVYMMCMVYMLMV